jgi:hypothetical protein
MEDPYLRADRDDSVQALQDILAAVDAGADSEALKDLALSVFTKITMRRMGVAPPDDDDNADLIPIKIGAKTGVKAWCKRLLAIDDSEHGGYSFIGPFLPLGTTVRLPRLTLLLRYDQFNADAKSVSANISMVERDSATGIEGFQKLVESSGAHWAAPLKEKGPQLLSIVGEYRRREGIGRPLFVTPETPELPGVLAKGGKLKNRR